MTSAEMVPNEDFVDQVEELQVVIFNRLEPASISFGEHDIKMHLASSDLLSILHMFVDKANDNISSGDSAAQLSRQSIAPWVLESKLSGLVAKVLRTYQREYRKNSSAAAAASSGHKSDSGGKAKRAAVEAHQTPL